MGSGKAYCFASCSCSLPGPVTLKKETGDLEEGKESPGRVELDDPGCHISSPASQGPAGHVLAKAPGGQQPKPGHVYDLLDSGACRDPVLVLDGAALEVERAEYRQGQEPGLIYELQLLRKGGALVAGQQPVRLHQGFDRRMDGSPGIADAVDSTWLRRIFQVRGCELQVLLCGDLSTRQRTPIQADRFIR